MCSNLEICAAWGGVSCRTDMLKMADNYFSADLSSPNFGLVLDGAGLCSASVSSSAACVTEYSVERLGGLL